MDVQRDDIVDATMALKSTEVDVMLNPPVVYSFRQSGMCRQLYNYVYNTTGWYNHWITLAWQIMQFIPGPM